MVNVVVNFPILGLKDKDSNVYVFKNHIGIVSKGGEKFYHKLWIIDSLGNTFLLKESSLKGRAPFKYSLKYFQNMYELDLVFEDHGNLSLYDLKENFFNNIKSNRQKWISLGTIEMIEEMINTCSTFKELIMIFE